MRLTSVKHLLRLHFFSTAAFKRFANKPDLRTSRAAFKPRPLLSRRARRDAEPFPQQAAASSLRLSKFGVLRRGTPALPRRKTHKHTHPRRPNPRRHRGSLSVAAGWQLEHKHSQLELLFLLGVGGVCLGLLGGGAGGLSQFILVSPHSQSRGNTKPLHYGPRARFDNRRCM